MKRYQRKVFPSRDIIIRRTTFTNLTAPHNETTDRSKHCKVIRILKKNREYEVSLFNV